MRRILVDYSRGHDAKNRGKGFEIVFLEEAAGVGSPYLVMEFVEGQPIDQYCDRNQLSIDERLQLFRQVCSAVQYAHENLVIHRDLKPGNILIAKGGVPRLLDFGIAKLLNPECFQTPLVTRTSWRPKGAPS